MEPTGPDGNRSLNDLSATFWTKFLVIPGLLLTTIISILVFAGLEQHWTFGGSLYGVITDNRSTVQTVVQIVSAVLGMIQVQTVCTVINFTSRISLGRHPISLDRLKLLDALSIRKMDWDLAKRDVFVLLSFALATLIPSALWAGALTPVTADMHNLKTSTHTPRYSNNSYDFWKQGQFSDNGNKTVTRKGIFSYVPVKDRYGFLITDGAAASSVDGTPLLHKKNDNTNFTYYGRSYGVGSSVGLFNDILLNDIAVTGYRYHEIGYQAQVQCLYNSSTLFGFRLAQNGSFQPKWQLPFLYLATGPGPNTTQGTACAEGDLIDCGGVITAGDGGPDDIVAFAWWASFESGLAFMGLPRIENYTTTKRPPASPAFMSIAAGSSNANLNTTQCSITMVSTLFEVHVDTVTRLITVKPQDIQSVPDIEPSGFIADSASAVLGFMSGVDTTLSTSVLGNMLQRNVQNIEEQNRPSESYQQRSLRAVTETTEMLIDDALLATASAQLMVAKDFHMVPAIVMSRGLVFGEKGYAIAVMVMNALVVLLYVAEAFRTRGWSGLAKFNFTDAKTLVISASLGGVDVGKAVNLQHQGTRTRSIWVGDAGDRVAGAVNVMLKPSMALVLAHSGTKASEDDQIPLQKMPSVTKHKYARLQDDNSMENTRLPTG